MKKEFIADLVTVVEAERTVVKAERTALKSERTAVKAERTAVKAERTAVKSERKAVNEVPVPTKSEIKLKTDADWGDLSQCFVKLKTTKEIKIPTKIEDEGPNIFQSVSSKCILNLTPVVKLNRNQEIELAVQEGKNQLMRKCVQSVILDMKSEVDQLTVPVVLGEMREIHECMKELMEVNDEDHCEDNAEIAEKGFV
ncbi:uncharacterized protein LOC129001834 isoform X2 [Macrosteles quadrilineatus]|uniref:uncharacterized protein LOC129001834 isoform X2 n=1 Tax=Macrosteles quadrilineatus TaxID=74068 RepID=UPI0023E2BB76|nr:uncharacterized protein LOC129001834 isoform X2 [Macrosteles quadrilineatus]